MKNRSYAVGLLFVGLLFLALTSLGWGQTCPGGLTLTNKWCGPYTVPLYDCLSGTNTTTHCHNMGGSLNVGFYSTSPTSGSGGNPFSGIGALGINGDGDGGVAHPDVVSNGSVGQNQYMLFANNNVQAYTKSGSYPHVPIWVNNSGDTVTHPQFANSPWEPYLGSGYCGQETANFDVAYDHVDTPPTQGFAGLWVLAGIGVAFRHRHRPGRAHDPVHSNERLGRSV